MISVGDKIKVIPKSYIDLAKAGLNQPDSWAAPNQDTKTIMLGGEYKVLAISSMPSSYPTGSDERFYKLLEDGSSYDALPEKYILPISEFHNCPYKKRDLVFFRPKCSEQDKAYLKSIFSSIYRFDDNEKRYEITDIINDYYIFINFDKASPFSFPFRWEDFESA